MKFIVRKSSDWNYEKEIEINTLEELMDFKKNCGDDIIISEDFVDNSKDIIEIYDYWRE